MDVPPHQRFKLLGLSGSLRRASNSTAILRTLKAGLTPDIEMEIVALDDIPPYNEDNDIGEGPAGVAGLRRAVIACDGIVVVSPEYNHGIPGHLKNAIDWASRPPNQVLDAKPVAIFGTSPGATGTIRGQAHLRQILGNLNSYVLVQPVVAIGNAPQRFDADANITDEATRAFVVSMLVKLVDWTRRLKA